MDLAELQKEAHAIAKEQGWRDQERTFGDCIALIHSGLSEALVAYRVRELTEWTRPGYWPPHLSDPPKRMGVASELAEVVIRVADMAEYYGVVAESDPRMRGRIDAATRAWLAEKLKTRTFGDWVTACHESLSKVEVEHDLKSRPWPHYLGLFLETIQKMATHYDIDLDAAIVTKMEYLRRTERW